MMNDTSFVMAKLKTIISSLKKKDLMKNMHLNEPFFFWSIIRLEDPIHTSNLCKNEKKLGIKSNNDK